MTVSASPALANAIPVVETERLVMRAFREVDFPAYADFYADATQSSFVGGPTDRIDAWRRLAGMNGHWLLRGFGPWALEDKATHTFAGWCGLWRPEGWPENELLYSLMPQARGKGLITEAARAARDFAYNMLGWTTVCSLIDQRNAPSIAVASRLGAVYEKDATVRGAVVGIYRHPHPSKH